MAHILSHCQRLVCVVVFAPLLGAAQEKTSWDQDFQDGVKAYASGNLPQAVESLTAALNDAQAFPPQDLRRADVAHLLGMSYQFLGKFERTETLYAEARSILEANGEGGRKLLGILLDSLAQLRFEQERWKDAEGFARQAIELCSETRGERDPSTLVANRHLGEIYSAEGRSTEAETIFQRVIKAARENPAVGSRLLPNILRDEAFILLAKGQYRQAEPLLKEALDLSNKLGENDSETADSLLALARLYRADNNTARAEPLLKRAERIYEKNNDPCLAHALQELGLIATADGKYAIARQHLLRSVSIYRDFLGPDHINVAFAEVGLAEAYLGERNYADAKSVIEHALAKEQGVLTQTHAELARAHLTAARISEAQRLASEADSHYQQALNIYRRTTPRDSPVRVMAERQYERFEKSFRK
jgi:tetratricopeptide (TPR) repeat protein